MSDSPGEPLTFAMGNFIAEFPTDRLYGKNHMWGQRRENTFRFGFSAYAVRLLQDVYFLDWTVDVGVTVSERQEIGQIESKKAESSLYSPMSGRLERFNQDLLSDPSAINVDKYNNGWLFEVFGESNGLLTPAEYLDHLTAVWEVTQRTIKGQMNE
jgi:glycine cleavage system H protein